MNTERPPDIRIEDLEYPKFPDEIVAAFKEMAPMGASIEFNPDKMMEAASTEEGLDDFGTEEFVEPLSVVCQSIEKESGFNGIGRMNAYAQITKSLANRLRIENAYKQHPEIDDLELQPPMIIAGLPRSGTTHLHNLIAADTNLRSLPWWESQEPIPSAEEWGETEGRIQRAKDGLSQQEIVMPHFKRMHEMTWDHIHEEISLLFIGGSAMQYDTMGVLPSWREYYKSQDQTPFYLYLKRILKALSFLRYPEKRWILKSPQHLEQFIPIANVFPDATVFVTHRDPIAVVASMATMLCYSARIPNDAPIDVVKIGQWWRDILTDMLLACVRDREVLANATDILFHDFMADDIAVVKSCYELAGQPWDNEVEERINKYMEEHPRGRHGRIIYDLNDFEIDQDELTKKLKPYIERFGVKLDYSPS